MDAYFMTVESTNSTLSNSSIAVVNHWSALSTAISEKNGCSRGESVVRTNNKLEK